MWVVRPAGTHLSEAVGGGQRGLARDDGTNTLEAHATLFPLDEDEDQADPPTDPQPVFVYVTEEAPASEQDDVLYEILASLVLIGALKAAEKLAPHAWTWWDERALPAVKSTWNKPKAWKGRKRAAADAMITSGDTAAPSDASRELGAALEAYQAGMSSEEARQRLVAALLARLFSDGQLKVVREARIEDKAGSPELPSATALTPEQLGESITMMLEANPSLLDEATLVEIGRIIGVGQADNERVLVEIEEA